MVDYDADYYDIPPPVPPPPVQNFDEENASFWIWMKRNFPITPSAPTKPQYSRPPSQSRRRLDFDEEGFAPRRSRRVRRKSPKRSRKRRSCKHGALKKPVKLSSGRKRYCKLAPKRSRARRKSPTRSRARRKSPKRSRTRRKSPTRSRARRKSPSKVSKTHYTITQYTKNKAKKLGVTVKRSTNKKKKLDVFKKGKKIATVGAMGYKDYPTYLKTEGKEKANKRRKAYKMRHEKDRHKKGSNGYYADQLLW